MKKIWAILLCLISKGVFGYVVTVDLTWEEGFVMQEGSIIQVIVYNKEDASKPQKPIDDNFAGNGEYYYYDSLPENHVIIEELALEDYSIFRQYIIDDYNRIYIRFFSETDFSGEEARFSYWGLSSIIPIQGNPNREIYLYAQNLESYGEDYFAISFEVIPEKETWKLLISGFFLIIVFRSYAPPH